VSAAVGADACATAADAEDGFAVAVVGELPEVTALPGSDYDDNIVDWLQKMIVQNSLLAHLAPSAQLPVSIAEPPLLVHHSALQLQPRNIRFRKQVIQID